MIRRLRIENYKSVEHVELELGEINVFIGANGSGKSNLLEAVGMLSAAASGRVGVEQLSYRGVRPSAVQLHQSWLRPKAGGDRPPPPIVLGATWDGMEFAVSLTPATYPGASEFLYHTEHLTVGEKNLVARPPIPSGKKLSSHSVRMRARSPTLFTKETAPVSRLNTLSQYAIFTPTTAVMRSSFALENRDQRLDGGDMLDVIQFARSHPTPFKKKYRGEVAKTSITDEALSLISWCERLGDSFTLTRSSYHSDEPVDFRLYDRFMRPPMNGLVGSEVSEGALYILFMAAMVASPIARSFFAVEAFDHALNPRLARTLMAKIEEWSAMLERPQQMLLTTHSPLTLDGLDLTNDATRLFTVSRTGTGRTVVRRVEVTDDMRTMAQEGLPLSRMWVMGNIGGVDDV